MHVVSVNVGERSTVRVGERAVETGIDKRPVGRAVIHSLGVTDDAVVDTRHHGGVDQAVYVYSLKDYRWWEGELGRNDLRPGLFGENLTLDLGDHGPLRIGDRLDIGFDVTLEVTSPRIPCAVFTNAVGEPRWVERFNEARRHGAYCRVLAKGEVSEGDEVVIRQADPSFPDVEEVADLHLARRPDPDRVRWILDHTPIGERARNDFLRDLSRTTGG